MTASAPTSRKRFRCAGIPMAVLLLCAGAQAQTTIATGVHFVQVDVAGGNGGNGGADGGYLGGNGGRGAVIRVVVPVTAGNTYTLTQGTNGGNGQSGTSSGMVSQGGAGGTPAGGAGASTANGVGGYSGAGGGGGGNSTFAMSGIFIRAGGGGGGGGGSDQMGQTQPEYGRSSHGGSAPTTGVPASAANCAATQVSGAAGTGLPYGTDGGTGGGGGSGYTAGLAGLASTETGVAANRRVATGGGAGGSCIFISPGAIVGSASFISSANAISSVSPLPALTLKQVWTAPPRAGDAFSMSTSGGSGTASITSAAPDSGPQLFTAGNTITFPAPTFTQGNAADYVTRLSCTGIGSYTAANPFVTTSLPASLSIGASNTDAVCTYQMSPRPLLSITKSLSPTGPWKVAQSGTVYNLAVANNGLGPTTGPIQLQDMVPAGLSITGTSAPAGWSCSTSGQLVSCSHPNPQLAPLQSTSIQIGVSVTAAATPDFASQTLTNHASMGGDGVEFPVIPAPGPGCATAAQCAHADVTVEALVLAVNDTAGASATAGTASPALVANVAANDRINGQAVTLGTNATVAPVGTWPAGITLGSNGAVDVAGTAQPGTHVLSYRLCPTAAPANCSTAQISLAVNANIAPQNDPANGFAQFAMTLVDNVAANDSVNGQPATLGAGGNASVSMLSALPTGITFDASSGKLASTLAVAEGDYTLNYQLCDRSAPPNCATASISLRIQKLAVVPTLNAWGLLLLGGLFSAMATLRLRRRQQP